MKTQAERVINSIVHHGNLNAQDVRPENKFVDLGFDSLDELELVMALEEEFGIEISDEEAENITTVAQAIEFIAAQTPNVELSGLRRPYGEAPLERQVMPLVQETR